VWMRGLKPLFSRDAVKFGRGITSDPASPVFRPDSKIFVRWPVASGHQPAEPALSDREHLVGPALSQSREPVRPCAQTIQPFALAQTAEDTTGSTLKPRRASVSFVPASVVSVFCLTLTARQSSVVFCDLCENAPEASFRL